MITTRKLALIFTVATALGLAACGGTESETPTPPAGTPNQPPTNSAPTISGSPLTSIASGASYVFQPSAADADGDTLAFGATGLPAWAAINAQTGMLSGTPAQADVGMSASIVIRVSDGHSTTSLQGFRITVTSVTSPPPVNAAPTINGTPATSVQATMAYTFTPSASDPDGQTLTFSIANKPSWAAFNTSTGRLSGTPASTNAGTFQNIVISASDGALSASLTAFSITVSAAPNHAPTISGTPAGSVVAGTAYSFTPSASDADQDMLAFTITSKPAWATFSTATGKLSGVPTTAQAGSYLGIVIKVSDGKVSTALPTFAITVSQPAATGTAALSWTAPTQNTDGSALTDLAGYRVYHGTSPDALNDITQISNAGTTNYSFSQLASGTHYFAVAAFSNSGVESALSGVGSKTIL